MSSTSPNHNAPQTAASIVGDLTPTRIEELGRIIMAYSEVTDRLQISHDQLQRQVAHLRSELSEKNRLLERKNRLAALGEMAAGMAHEIRNPLGGIQLYASLLAKDVADRPPSLELVKKISGGVKRLEALVSQVLHFAREIRASVAPCDLSAIVAQSVELSAQQRNDANVECHVLGPETLPVTIDSLLIGQCLLNLLLNAIEAMAEDATNQSRRLRRLTVRFDRPPIGSDARQFHLSVTDSGPGISPSVLDKIFNPFFTTKDAGTGLGLAIVHRVIEAHDGSIIACNCTEADQGGAKFEIRIQRPESGSREQMARILVVDDQEMMRDSLAATLAREQHDVTAAGDPTVALAKLSAQNFDLLISDLKMPKMTGIELLAEAKKLRPEMPVVLMTAFATVQTAVEAMKLGAYDYIQKPFDGDEIKMLVDRTLEHNRLIRENQALRTMTEATLSKPLIGSGEAMEEIRKRIELVARSNATVLIRGESGTGKEVIARAIHAASDRKDRPMLAVNCAALSENLLESELFGHEKGAFTGADRLRRGRFELADGGTLLLDEVTEIAPSLQAKLLRVLQENAFERVGSSLTQQVDVRVIATTNRDLESAVAEGHFRSDLFYRLNVVPIDLTPLRRRTEDVPELCRHFLHQIARREKSVFRHIETEAVRMLQRYNWPGNVRELQNIIERACVLETEAGVIRASTIEPWLKMTDTQAAPAVDALAGKPLADIEKQVILKTLQQFRGHRIKTASALGIGVRTLGMKIKKWKEDGELVESVL